MKHVKISSDTEIMAVNFVTNIYYANIDDKAHVGNRKRNVLVT